MKLVLGLFSCFNLVSAQFLKDVKVASRTITTIDGGNHHFHRKRDVATVLTTLTSYVEADSDYTTSSYSSVATKASQVTHSSVTPSSTSSTSLGHFEEPSDEFEDGVLSCSDGVPTRQGNGVVAVDWVGIDGWASVMDTDGNTAKKCKDNYYCSYACQAGMSKTQWPSNQPGDGQTRGGLLCKNGKLYRTNTNTKHLCEWGKQTVNAVSKLDKVVSLCRTDYPGSENMVVPTRLSSGQTQPISVVDGSSYFKWQNKETSAQYYVNNAGVDVEKGCVWGTSSGTVGNWAPVVLGASYSNGLTYASIIPNPNNKNPPNYNLKIEPGPDSTLSGSCSYIDGSYSGSGSDGCTVGVTKGTAHFVFY